MAASKYYEAYQDGYRAAEVDNEMNRTRGIDEFTLPPEGVNKEAWLYAQSWGYEDGYNAIGDPCSEQAVEGFLENKFAI